MGTSFKDMVLDLIERSHLDYERKIAETLTTALSDLEHCSAISADKINDWLTNVCDNSNDE